MHRIKGDAATLGLASVESRTHAFEDLLKDLRDRPQLSGNDFLPLVVGLDEIFGHLQSIRELASRADALRANALLTAAPRAGAAATPADAGKQDMTPPAGRAGPAHRRRCRQESPARHHGSRRGARRHSQDGA